MLTLTFVRHGETEMNKADIVQSRTPGDLTERGIQMAENLGKYLQDEKFDRVYTSDLKRCHDTTLNILKHSVNSTPEPILYPILRERDYGDLEFQSGQLVRDLMKQHGLTNHEVPIPGGESHTDVMKRCATFFEEICKLADESNKPLNILAVSHGAWILTFLDYMAANPDKFELENYVHEDADLRPLRNTGRTKLHVGKLEGSGQKRPIKFVCVHNTKHLEDM